MQRLARCVASLNVCFTSGSIPRDVPSLPPHASLAEQCTVLQITAASSHGKGRREICFEVLGQVELHAAIR